MQNQFFCLVMAGGKGTRFWPESTSKKPKQYLSFLGNKSLLTSSLIRVEGLIPKENRYVVTLKEQEKYAMECSKGLCAKDGLIFEPSGRNTAPCILLALAYLLDKGASPNDVVAIIPSDHVILNENGFRNTLNKCFEVAVSQNTIVTIGITPNFPHTGYGYIQKGERKGEAFKVAAFKEKPNIETAKDYLASGNYFWNAGIFISKIQTLLDEFKSLAPDMYKHFKDLKGNPQNLKNIYDLIPSDSIDYAIMEKSEKVMVIPASFDWNDLGSWEALEALIPSTEGNTMVKCKSYYLENSKGNIVYAPNQLVSILGVNDLIVVSNEKALMILPKAESQKVKNIVEFLKKEETTKGYL
ncbi:MAG: mannose-1-phosphate guanylyltransferase [Bacteriovoracales bacterium]